MKIWPRAWPRRLTYLLSAGLLGLALLGGWSWYHYSKINISGPTVHINKLQFDQSLTIGEQALISQSIAGLQPKSNFSGPVFAYSATSLNPSAGSSLLSVYVPVTDPYAIKQSITSQEISAEQKIYIPNELNPVVSAALATTLNLDPQKFSPTSDIATTLLQNPGSLAFINAKDLTPALKLLRLNNHYYLDDFSSGAVFRSVQFSGTSASQLPALKLGNFATSSNVLKLNMSGVTALTRALMLKINASGDPAYPAKNIGGFLADADFTQTSDEVSFKTGCVVSDTVFCATPSSIKTLKASGINIVELTGNHNNDAGTTAGTNTINLYHSLGWGTFGGGLNAAAAAKPYVINKKGSQVALLGYNYYDTVYRSAALAGPTSPGAASFSFAKIKAAIAAAKALGNFVIVDVQYQECYSYPDGYVLDPACYKPLASPDQKADFERIINEGADMVIGTQAHQPQTYEMYKGKPIYFGLGNLYFDQFEWPGTEQGIILTHYFLNGRLLQTKLSPTIYNQTMQPRLMTDSEATNFLKLLQQAR